MRYDHVTMDRLKEMLDFDPEVGVFIWRQRPCHNSKRHPGEPAGSKKPNGYLYITIDGRSYVGSQLAFFWVHGRWARGQVGLANGDRSDFRAENLVEMRTAPGKHDHTTREGRARRNKAYWEANPDFRRELEFKRYYNISFADYQRLHAAQNGLCAICDKPESSVHNGKVRWLAVDHCHTTAVVRGLLCMNCNSAIGRLGDDPTMLEKAAAYLRAAIERKAA